MCTFAKKTACEKSSYTVQYIDQTLFKNVDQSLKLFSSFRPRKKAGDPVVIYIKALKYKTEGVFYKLRHTDLEWTEIPAWINTKAKSI